MLGGVGGVGSSGRHEMVTHKTLAVLADVFGISFSAVWNVSHMPDQCAMKRPRNRGLFCLCAACLNDNVIIALDLFSSCTGTASIWTGPDLIEQKRGSLD